MRLTFAYSVCILPGEVAFGSHIAMILGIQPFQLYLSSGGCTKEYHDLHGQGTLSFSYKEKEAGYSQDECNSPMSEPPFVILFPTLKVNLAFFANFFWRKCHFLQEGLRLWLIFKNQLSELLEHPEFLLI